MGGEGTPSWRRAAARGAWVCVAATAPPPPTHTHTALVQPRWARRCQPALVRTPWRALMAWCLLSLKTWRLPAVPLAPPSRPAAAPGTCCPSTTPRWVCVCSRAAGSWMVRWLHLACLCETRVHLCVCARVRAGLAMRSLASMSQELIGAPSTESTAGPGMATSAYVHCVCERVEWGACEQADCSPVGSRLRGGPTRWRGGGGTVAPPLFLPPTRAALLKGFRQTRVGREGVWGGYPVPHSGQAPSPSPAAQRAAALRFRVSSLSLSSHCLPWATTNPSPGLCAVRWWVGSHPFPPCRTDLAIKGVSSGATDKLMTVRASCGHAWVTTVCVG